MAKYNVSLDKLVVAAALFRKGRHDQAARMFAEASAHASLSAAAELVNNFNKKATAAAVKPSVTKPVKASKAQAWPWAATTASAGSDVLDTQNDDFGIEPDENDLLNREVQEADAVEDMDDLDLEESSAEDELDIVEESPEEVARARFERALANMAHKA